ncbi:DUF2946 family protein [Methylosinus sp. LW4]|uniref:DUF2946 family protein n=1 Tax=Methylosinus sp. LW4 TaxID=136993 RepID=UPI00037D372A|nr:DUF2946 family protein [Methylosinus sp. LW4]
MVALPLSMRRWASRFAAAALACLLLSEALSFVITATRHAAVSNGDVVAAAELCDARLDASGNPPAHPESEHGCALCIVCARDLTFDAVGLLASVVIVLAPRPNDAPARFDSADPAPSPPGWTSSWSSRAPPRFS